MKQERLTNQKKIILDYLHSVKIHPSAEKVFKEVRKKLPRISQATVYRILNNLQEKKEVQVISAKGISRFDGNVSSHAHFVCQKCDKVYDICDVCKECSILRKKKTKVGKINSYKVCFHGICKCCK